MTKDEIQKYAKRATRIMKDDFILSECKGKSVLDVGCIGQDRNFSSANWLHNKVKAVAKNVDGVDILTDQILELKKLGYSMLSIKELEEKISDYWNDENLPEEGFTNVIVDSPLLTALKRLEQCKESIFYIVHALLLRQLYFNMSYI